jgi:hypothetical protein
MRKTHLFSWIALFAVSLILSGCSGSPTASSSAASQGVTLHGVALDAGAAVTSMSHVHSMAAGDGTLTVTVQGTSISTKVSGNGTFELEGLPSGNFTLVFTRNGATLGSVTVNGVPAETDVKIVVQVNATTVILVKLDMGDNEGDDAGGKTCVVDGGKVGSGIEVEGKVSSVSGSTFTMQVNGNRSSALVTVNATAASFKCNAAKASDNGKNGGNDDDQGEDGTVTCNASHLAAGVQVHVSGTLTSCSTSAAAVTATQIMIQKGNDD